VIPKLSGVCRASIAGGTFVLLAIGCSNGNYPTSPSQSSEVGLQSTSADLDAVSRGRAEGGAIKLNQIPGATVITFSEFPVNTAITTQYQGDGIIFGGSSPFITNDGANPTSPVLSGSPLFMGSIAGGFVVPGSTTPATVGSFSLDAGFFDAVGSTELKWFDASGTLIGSQVNTGLGIETFTVTAPGIASWSIGLIASDPLGFAIDNVCFDPVCNTMFDNPTGDPVIDDPNVQAGFLDAIQKSGAFDGTPKNNRLEHAGYVYRRPDGSLYTVLNPSPQIQTPCEVTPGPPMPQDPNDEPIAGFHTHPHTPGSQGPSCLGIPYNPFRTGGGSTDDWNNFVEGSPPTTMFVIDKEYVYRNDPGVPTTQRRNAPRHRWNPALCGL